MKAVRLYNAMDLRVEEIERPPLPPRGFVNIDVRAAGICGSDLHNFRTGQWISRRPSTAGHEFCGRISAVGDDVAAFAVGDYVSVDSRVYCGSCAACASGRTNVCEVLGFVGEVCDGGFAEQVQIPARLVIHHEPSLDPRVAAMAEPLAVALHAVRRLDAPSGESVLLIGCGTIGGLAGLLLARLHEGQLLFADLKEDRARLVAKICNGKAVGLDRAEIAEALQGKRLRYALDASGSVKAIGQGLDLLAGGGALALVGISHGRLDLDPNILVEREIALLGCHAYEAELIDAVAMLPQLESALLEFCEVLTSLDEIPSAYRRLLDGQTDKLKIIVQLAE